MSQDPRIEAAAKAMADLARSRPAMPGGFGGANEFDLATAAVAAIDKATTITTREQLAKEVFIADNGRLERSVAAKEWDESTPAHRIYAYAIADHMARLIAAQVDEAVNVATRATVTAYVEAYPGFREGWGTNADPESKGARGIATKTVAWLQARAARP